jgi:hypothetical protein
MPGSWRPPVVATQGADGAFGMEGQARRLAFQKLAPLPHVLSRRR